MTVELAVGDPAPDFSLPRDGDGTVSLDSYRKRKLVLYFYPRADTPGCILEAQAFTVLEPEFAAAGADILGASADPVKKQTAFRRKFNLGFPLAADETHEMLEAYGVWVEKSMYGRKYMGVDRVTYLIAPGGRIARIWRKVKIDGHAAEVLEAAKAL